MSFIFTAHFFYFFPSAHLLFSPLFMLVPQHGSKADIPSSLNSNLKFCYKQTAALPVSLYSVTFSFPVWKMSANWIGIHLITFIYLDEGLLLATWSLFWFLLHRQLGRTFCKSLSQVTWTHTPHFICNFRQKNGSCSTVRWKRPVVFPR